MDYCHHGFLRETCQLCRMETTNKAPLKLVDDLRDFELVGPKPRIKDNLSKLNPPDLSIRSIEPPDPVVPSSLDPSKQIIDTKKDLMTEKNLKLGMEIIDPKKNYLMKK